MIELLEGMIKDGEGNISWFPHRIKIMKNILTTHKPKNIVEIGFNLGHSIKIIIDTLNSLEDYNGIENIYVFDICDEINDNGSGGNHSYVIQNFNILKKHFNNINIELIKGDSIKTVKPFLEKINHKIDFVEIDGFHEDEHPYLDIQNTLPYLKSGGILYIDDYNSGYNAIDNAIIRTNWEGFDLIQYNDIMIAIKK